MGDVQQFESQVKGDAQKAADAIRAAEGDVVGEEVKAESWVEKHPATALYAGICLGLVIIVILFEFVKRHV